MSKYFLTAFVLISLAMASCKDKKLDPSCGGEKPTYDNGISVIIDANCTSPSCHGAGALQAQFIDYASMALALSNGNFEKKVLVEQSMPKNNFLTQDEINLIQCWKENGYPEN
ncbi:MAG: hypothetical protein JKY18_11900 [Flavobacteriales bacterium]|nr:hypothetical protein [Flavobacteriales bacterium]MBL4736015.1 hypothetical protein [Flavobacteriales bacterium]PCH88809.1 MAG: hypothetical protein COB88_03125 [Flavobacteriales bacterium]